MSITDELRNFANEWDWLDYKADESERRLRAIADRIDADVTDLLRKQDADLRAEFDHLCDGYVIPPKDADGEYIHVGDVMENIVHPPTHREVTAIGAECFYAWVDGQGRYSQFDASCYRHHKPPTVEDVLHELVGKAQMLSCVDDEDKLVADFAQRLTLAGDAE